MGGAHVAISLFTFGTACFGNFDPMQKVEILTAINCASTACAIAVEVGKSVYRQFYKVNENYGRVVDV